MQSKIFIHDLHIPFTIGVSPVERLQKRLLRFNASVEYDWQFAGQNDDFSETFDYSLFENILTGIAREREFLLLEAIAIRYFEEIFQIEKVCAAKLCIEKVNPAGMTPCTAGIEISCSRENFKTGESVNTNRSKSIDIKK